MVSWCSYCLFPRAVPKLSVSLFANVLLDNFAVISPTASRYFIFCRCMSQELGNSLLISAPMVTPAIPLFSVDFPCKMGVRVVTH